MRTREELHGKVRALIEASVDGHTDTARRDALLDELVAYQTPRVEPLKRLAEARPGTSPAVPTDVFRFTRVASHAPSDDLRVFRTSGTTQSSRGTHAFQDLSLYDLAAKTAARWALFPDVDKMDLAFIAPHERLAADSSLSYMFSRFAEWFGVNVHWLWRREGLDLEALKAALEQAERSQRPLALFGTTLAYIHVDEQWEAAVSLPAGSRAMHTGGTKGAAHAVAPDEARRRIANRFGLPETHVVAEYGMTELSSQMYETTLRDSGLERDPEPNYWIPGWMRVRAVDPDTLAPLSDGEAGLLRFDDAANLDSVASIQTADVGRVVGGRVELLGRDTAAVARGCSLAAEAALEPPAR